MHQDSIREIQSGAGADGKPLKKRLAAGALFILIPLLIHALVSALTVGDGPPISSGHLIKVLLATGTVREPAVFSVDGPYHIYQGGEPHGYGDPGITAYGYRLGGAEVTVLADGRIALNDTPLGIRSLCLVPEKDGTIEVDNTSFSGMLLIEDLGDGKTRLVNLIDIEEYLAGVLFREMPSAFPREALKSQLVAARTYALYMTARGEGLLMADERSQVYGGATASRAKSRRLVSETAGEVVTFSGDIIPAYYSSTCGGMTVKANDVFPYLSPAPLNNNTPCGYCSDSPHYRWSATFPLGEIVRKFGLEKTCQRPEVGITEVDSTRRAREISILDRKGTVLRRLHSDDFRRIINKGRPLKRRMRSTRIDSITLSGNAVTIEGGGYGHGVGLCQYGARGLAKEGRDYRQILDYYYRGCEIKTLAELSDSGPAEQ